MICWHLRTAADLVSCTSKSLWCPPRRRFTHTGGRSLNASLSLFRVSQLSFDANSTLFGVPLSTATTDERSANWTKVRRSKRKKVSLLEVQPPRDWWVGWKGINCWSLQTLSGRIDLISPRAPFELVNSAGVISKSPTEKRSLVDAIAHLSSELALLTVRTKRNLPSKSTTTQRDDLRQNQSKPCLDAPRIELVHSLLRRFSDPHPLTKSNDWCAKLAPLEAAERCVSICAD